MACEVVVPPALCQPVEGVPFFSDDPAFAEAQAFSVQGRVDEALRLYAEIGQRQAARHCQDALVHEGRGEKDEAVACLKKAVAVAPTYRLAWAKLATLQSGADAERAFQRVLALDPCDVDARIGLAQLLMRARKLHEAASLLESLLPNEEIRFILAHILWQLGDFPRAEEQLRLYLRGHASDERAVATLVELLNREDRLADAEAVCRCYVGAGGSARVIRVEWARVLMRQQRWSDAESILGELIRADVGDVPLWRLYAELLEKSGRSDDARAVHAKNVESAPRDLEVYLQWADFEYRCGNPGAAKELCASAETWLAKAPDWGLHRYPESLESRLIFHSLHEIAATLCTGQRALLDRTGLDMAGASAFGEIVEFFCMVSGQGHIDFLESVAFPALASSAGFDRLLAERRCVYNIYTTPADYPGLAGFLSNLEQRGIRYRVNVELLGVSQELYTILALPIIDQLKRSLAMNSIVVMALPDAIVAGSVHRVIEDMKPFETVVCAMPRINSDLAYPALKAHFSAAVPTPLVAREFVRLSMNEFRHPQTYSALVSDTPCLKYRDLGGYYAAHNWAPPPLCFHARAEMLEHMLRNPLCGPNSIASFYTVDHDFVDSAWRSGNLRLIETSDYFFWAEFTGPTRHGEFLAGRKAEGYYYPESARAVFQHEFKWVYGEPGR